MAFWYRADPEDPAVLLCGMARIEIPEGEGGDAVQVWTLRPELGRAVGRLSHAAYQQSELPTRVREAARMRIAQLNDCPV